VAHPPFPSPPTPRGNPFEGWPSFYIRTLLTSLPHSPLPEQIPQSDPMLSSVHDAGETSLETFLFQRPSPTIASAAPFFLRLATMRKALFPIFIFLYRKTTAGALLSPFFSVFQCAPLCTSHFMGRFLAPSWWKEYILVRAHNPRPRRGCRLLSDPPVVYSRNPGSFGSLFHCLAHSHTTRALSRLPGTCKRRG